MHAQSHAFAACVCQRRRHGVNVFTPLLTDRGVSEFDQDPMSLRDKDGPYGMKAVAFRKWPSVDLLYGIANDLPLLILRPQRGMKTLSTPIRQRID